MVAAKLLTLNRRTAGDWDIPHLKRRISYHHPIIGIHIRRGDSCHNNGRSCFALNRYMEEALLFKARYGVSNIFVATDSSDIIQEILNSVYWQKQFFFTYVNWNRDDMNSNVVIEQRMASKHAQGPSTLELARSAWLDFELLSAADFLIGHLSSNLFRTVQQVSAGPSSSLGSREFGRQELRRRRRRGVSAPLSPPFSPKHRLSKALIPNPPPALSRNRHLRVFHLFVYRHATKVFLSRIVLSHATKVFLSRIVLSHCCLD